MSEVLLESVLVCPVCGFAKQETMPTDACQYFYERSNCKMLLRPKPGDCCVFCSYGSVKCPPMQEENHSCCAAGIWSAPHRPNLVKFQQRYQKRHRNCAGK